MNDYEKRLDTDHTHEPICPHCGHEVADAWELPDETESVKCEECINIASNNGVYARCGSDH